MKHLSPKTMFVALVVLLSHALAVSQNPCALDPAWDADGTLKADAYYETAAMLVLPDGKLLAASNSLNSLHTILKRFNADGSLDLTYGTGGQLMLPVGESKTEVLSLFHHDGIVYVAGAADDIDAWQVFYPYVAATTVDGAIVSGFGQNGFKRFDIDLHAFGYASDVIADGNGNIYVAGEQNNDTFFVAKLTPAGDLMPAWDGDGISKVGLTLPDTYWDIRDMALDSNGQVLVTGRKMGNLSSNLPEFQQLLVARFAANGSLDNTFGTGGIGIYNSTGNTINEGKAIMVTPANAYIVAGFIRTGIDVYLTTTAIDHNGLVDSSYAADGWGIEYFGQSTFWESDVCASLLPDGHILLSASRESGVFKYFTLIMLNPDGSHDLTFGANGLFENIVENDNLNFIKSMTIDPQGKIYLGGFSQVCINGVCGTVYVAIARYNYTFGAVGANDPAQVSITAFPNPVAGDGMLRLQGIDASSVQAMELLDVAGKCLKSVSSSGEMLLPNLASGIYCLRVTTATAVFTQKMVVYE